MNDDRIDYLIAQRNKLLQRRDALYDRKRIDAIDAKLAAVPAGQRNDVDLALGRPEAQLPERPGYIVNPIVMLEQSDTAQLAEATVSVFEAEMRRLCADYDIEAPTYDGMWM